MQEDKHLDEVGIATLTACFVNANRDPKKGKSVSPDDFFYFKPDVLSGSEIGDEIANTFFALVKDKKIPAWSVPLCPVDIFIKHKTNGRVPTPRAWIGDRIILICPKTSNNKVTAKFCLLESVSGTLSVRDVDSGYTVLIYVPPQEYPSLWMLEVDFEIRR